MVDQYDNYLRYRGKEMGMGYSLLLRIRNADSHVITYAVWAYLPADKLLKGRE